MDENEEVAIERRKKNLLMAITQDIFEEDIREVVKNGGYVTIEELDALIDPKIKAYFELRHNIEIFYNSRICE